MNKIALIFLFLASFSIAEDGVYKSIEGSYFIWGDHMKEYAPEKMDGFSIFLTGESAKRFYEKMPQKAVFDECIDNGTVTKSNEGFSCSKSPKGKHMCSFGVNLEKHQISWAQSC